MHCLDKEHQCIEVLRSNLEPLNKFNQNWETYENEFDKKIHDILDEIESIGHDDHPMFYFIDPFGYSGFPMKTIKRILEYPRSELFINFMVHDINRFCEQELFKNQFIDLFGSEKFLDVNLSRNPEERQSFLLNLYCENIYSLTEAKFIMRFRINTPGKGTRPRYYLIHVSKNLKALKVMKDQMSKVSEVDYRFEAIGMDTQQMSLFDDPEKLKMIDQISFFCESHFPKNIEYGEIEDWAYVNTNGVSKTIKETLLQLEEEDKIHVERQPSQRKSTVTKGASIRSSKNN